MVRPAFQRDNVLSDTERTKSAKKCLQIIADSNPNMGDWRKKDMDFYFQQSRFARMKDYAPTEPILQWLRDLVERYVTN